jgi:2-oxoglutarate dehydrogenase E1 component
MKTAIATRLDPALLEEVYNRWKDDGDSVETTWSAFFEGFELGSAGVSPSQEAAQIGGTVPVESLLRQAAREEGEQAEETPLQTRVEALVYAYRTLGHTIAMLDPLSERRPENPALALSEFGFSDKDLDLVVFSRFFRSGKRVHLRDLIAALQQIYADDIGAEFMHIQNARVRNWLRERLEARLDEPQPDGERQLSVLRWLMEAEMFEHFLHSKYVGQKRFSLEGGESLMVALNILLEESPRAGIQEIVLGMAHRGRLNVLANFIQKSLKILFSEFSENYIPEFVGGDGDVKYHLGYSNVRTLASGEKVGLRLSSNPSHLEAVDPIVLGSARARQRICHDTAERRKVLSVLIHGDAAFAGQGIVAETLNLSQLPGYSTGGTIHLIVNNQIGFTTMPADARSSTYCTDVAKMIEAPIFHVNGDDPLAVAFATNLALEFRQQFKRDVVVDIVCYRRHGHNEGDEPAFTAPNLYARIHAHPSVVTLFQKELVARNIASKEALRRLEAGFEKQLEEAFAEVKQAEKESKLNQLANQFAESLAVFQPPYSFDAPDTSVTRECLERIVRGITTVPEGFHVLPKIQRMLLDRRARAFLNGGPFDWSYAETLAFGSLLLDGVPLRLSGQDSRRGTFSQRHSVLFDEKTSERYIPLMHLAPDQATFCVYNSLLSEAAVLGFDYGYSLGFPEMLCIWEAQFGDFANGAQVIIDQFIVSAESKWQRPSGLVMLLPHGYEGQGPEHSSGRMERFLQLCAEENIQVCNLTTPAQYFHVLRRQMNRPFLKPLVIFTPKSLLRSEKAVSLLADFTNARFQNILPDPAPPAPEKVERVIFCSGKVFYDLEAFREKDRSDRSDQTDRTDQTDQLGNTAIVRLEQLYPLDEEALKQAVAPFVNAKRFVWCQEEPRNMGAWGFIHEPMIRLFGSISYAGRRASASTAVGALALHKIEQKQLVEEAFAG